MDLRQLRYATVLAQTGNFVRAAEELHITQPALSRSIQALEDELGVKLFERGRHGARLTSEGQLLVERAEQVRLTLGGLRRDIDLSKAGQLGEVAFGMGPMVAAAFMADVLTELINRYPGIEVRSHVNDVHHLRDALLAEEIDFFLHSSGQLGKDPRITISPLGELPLSLFVRAEHPLATQKSLNIEDLSAYPFMAGSMPQLMKSIHPLLQSFKTSLSCDDFLTLKVVVQRTNAVWLTSRTVVAKECHQGTIIELTQPNQKNPLTANLVIASLAGRKLSPSADLVVQIIHRIYQDAWKELNPSSP